tara:strand:+ start:969 stop:1457 length:489 start_codon:yes stop_codon:yes gene_type:complete
MALIKLQDLSVSSLDNTALDSGYLYKDLFLDIRNKVWYNEQLNKRTELRDVQGLFDLDAIKNSIVNIFLTSPGQKILNPDFGLDLRRYIFEPISSFNSISITEKIKWDLPWMEPRINLISVDVVPDEDNNKYHIILQIDVPTLDMYGISIKSVLNSNGYYIS